METATIQAPTMTLDELERQLLELPREVRSHLAEVLGESVRKEVEEIWDEEAERRYQAYLRGEMKAYPAKEALAELRAKLLK